MKQKDKPILKSLEIDAQASASYQFPGGPGAVGVRLRAPPRKVIEVGPLTGRVVDIHWGPIGRPIGSLALPGTNQRANGLTVTDLAGCL